MNEIYSEAGFAWQDLIACARPRPEIDSIVKGLKFPIEDMSVQKAVGVNDAQELLFWTKAV